MAVKHTASTGDVIAEVAAERRRQVEAEGYDAAHDDGHPGEMALAAAAYAQISSAMTPYKDGVWQPTEDGRIYGVNAPECWPWSFDAWKPKNPRRDLIRAAALLVAEIERLDRASVADGTEADERDANARLIAAAPEMLAVLKLVELRLNQVQPGHGTRANDLSDYLIPPVRAAIAKAEG